jgi:transposase
MNTIGKNRWPRWLREVIGKRKNIEIKEHKGKYYAYSMRNVWDREKKRPRKISTYLGRVTEEGIVTTYETFIRGIYEYGHVRLLNHLFHKNGTLHTLKEIFPDYWRELFAFACNRIIDPRPIKSIGAWCEKTYLPKALGITMSPKRATRALNVVGMSWKSQLEFFDKVIVEGEKILYDGSVIVTDSETPLAEFRADRKNQFLKRVNIVVAFSQDRKLPVFFRVLPGSLHEISTLGLFLEEIEEKNLILVMDKGFTKEDLYKEIDRGKHGFIVSLKRDSERIDYGKRMTGFFMYRKRPVKYCSYRSGKFHVYLYEDPVLRAEEERTYYTLLSKGKRASFREEWAGKIALVSNLREPAKEIYDMWKGRGEIEKAFHVLQNLLDTDTPYVRQEETFRGYVFASFIGLIGYYLVLRLLKEADINSKVSVSDLLLELSKVYIVELKGKEFVSERTKRVRDLSKTLGLENLMTKIGWR